MYLQITLCLLSYLISVGVEDSVSEGGDESVQWVTHNQKFEDVLAHHLDNIGLHALSYLNNTHCKISIHINKARCPPPPPSLLVLSKLPFVCYHLLILNKINISG